MNPSTAEEQDTRDMLQLAEGHDAALNDLMERHAERLFHYALRSLQTKRMRLTWPRKRSSEFFKTARSLTPGRSSQPGFMRLRVTWSETGSDGARVTRNHLSMPRTMIPVLI